MRILLPVFALLLSGCSNMSLVGGLGVRDTTYWDQRYYRSIRLGPSIGELRLEADIHEHFYTSCSHISGINDAEGDYGLNYCSAGFRVDF